MAGKPSTVAEWRTYNPWKKKTVCGAFKAHMKERFIAEGLTEEDLLKDQKLFETILCQRNPVLNAGHRNGRCGVCGAYAGRHDLTQGGKYSKYFKQLDPDDLENHVGKKANNSLDAELGILSSLINEKCGQIKETATAADLELLKVADAMVKAYDKMDFSKLRELLSKIRELCIEGCEINKIKGSLAKDVKNYADVFKVSLQERTLNGEFIPLEIHVAQMIHIVNICAPVIVNDEERQKVNTKLQELIIGSRKQSPHPLSEANSSNVRSENQDEG